MAEKVRRYTLLNFRKCSLPCKWSPDIGPLQPSLPIGGGEQGGILICTGRKVSAHPVERPVGEKDDTLLGAFPDDLRLAILKVQLVPIQRENFAEATKL